jgi:hypothetical protein
VLFYLLPLRTANSVAGAELLETSDAAVSIALKPQASGLTQNWLERWLATLVIVIPDINEVKDSFKIGISKGICSQFQLDSIDTRPDGGGVRINAAGLSASCHMHWSVENIYIKSLSGSGSVNASAGKGQLGGPIAFGQAGDPPLPTSVVAHGCECTIEVTNLHFSGGILAAIAEVLAQVIKPWLGPIIGMVVCHELTAVTNGPATHALQNASTLIRSFLATKSNTSSNPPSLPEPHTDFADLGGNSGVLMAQKILKLLGNPASNFSLNKLIGESLGPNGSFTLAGHPVHKSFNLTGAGIMNVTLDNISVAGLNTWTQLDINSVSAQQVAFGLGLNRLSASVDIKLEVAPTNNSPVHGGKLEEDFSLAFDLKNFSTGAAVFAAINQTYLGTMALAQLANVGCLAPGLYSILDLKNDLHLPSTAVSLAPLGSDALDASIDKMINSMIALILTQFAPALDAVAGHGVAVSLRDTVNNKINSTVSNPTTCSAAPPTYANPGASHIAWYVGLVFAVASVMLAIVMYPVTSIVRKRKQKREVAVLLEAGNNVSFDNNAADNGGGPGPTSMATAGPTSMATARSTATFGRRFQPWDCLAFNPRVSIVCRWGLPLLDLTVVCLAIASNCSIATTVNAEVLADGEPILHLPDVFGFSLVSSIRDMWNGKVYGLALLVLVFSGIWPYTKLAVMQLCWFAPTSWLSPGRRLWFLEFLDAYGKWSLIDAFVMVLFMVAFKFNLNANNEQVWPPLGQLFNEAGASFQVNVYVNANLGFYIFLASVIGSLVVGHFMTACNRYACHLGEYSPSAVSQERGQRLRLCNTLRPDGYWEGKFFAYGPIVAMGLSLALMVVGIWIDVFAFNFEGLGGYVLNPDDRTRSFSVVSLGLAIPSASKYPASFGIIWLQCVFLAFAAFSVVTYFAILIVLWCAPLSPRLQSHFFVAAQVLEAWSGVDVFVISILASVLEIAQFVQFIIGDKCDAINPVLARLPIHFPGAQTCFQISTELRSGFYILLVAAFLSAVMGKLMINRCKTAMGMDVEHVNSFVSSITEDQ